MIKNYNNDSNNIKNNVITIIIKNSIKEVFNENDLFSFHL